MRGRKPKPTSLKILTGTQPCRINRNEPKIPSAASPEAPSWVGDYGREMWRDLAPILAKAGLLSEGDLAAFSLLCNEYDGVRRDPLNAGSRDRYRRLLVEFGLTPSARSRIKATAEPPKDELELFLAKKGS